MVHYIQKETVKKWLKCDDKGFDKIISETRTLLRTAENMSRHYYHSVDVHRLIMKQKVFFPLVIIMYFVKMYSDEWWFHDV